MATEDQTKVLPHVFLTTSIFTIVEAADQGSYELGTLELVKDSELAQTSPFSVEILKVLHANNREVRYVPPYPSAHIAPITEMRIIEVVRNGGYRGSCNSIKGALRSSNSTEHASTTSAVLLRPTTTWQRSTLQGADGFCCMYDRVVDEKTGEIYFVSIIASIDWEVRETAGSLARLCALRSISNN